MLERQEAVGDTGRDDDPLVRRELVCLDDGPITGLGEHRPDVDERDERPSRRDDPVIELAAVVVEPPQDTLGRCRQVGLDEPRLGPLGGARFGRGKRGERRRAPQLAERTPSIRVTRHRAEPHAFDRRMTIGHGRLSLAAGFEAGLEAVLAARWRSSAGR